MGVWGRQINKLQLLHQAARDQAGGSVSSSVRRAVGPAGQPRTRPPALCEPHLCCRLRAPLSATGMDAPGELEACGGRRDTLLPHRCPVLPPVCWHLLGGASGGAGSPGRRRSLWWPWHPVGQSASELSAPAGSPGSLTLHGALPSCVSALQPRPTPQAVKF